MKKLLLFTSTSLLLSFVSAHAGVAYGDPSGGWRYIYTGDAANGLAQPGGAALDNTWDNNNGSDEWDASGRGAGNGQPGGVESNNGILTIEDAVNLGSGTGNNRKLYFTHNMAQDGVTDNAILNNGITLSFRARLTPPDAKSEIPMPNGYGIYSDGKGNFGVRQIGPSGGTTEGLISFSLSQAANEANDTPAYALPSAGLVMNRLNGDAPSANVDITEAGTLNLLPLDPTVWHEFWITIQANDATPGNGTHTVTICLDGSTTPTVFNVTAGTGDDQGSQNYIAMGCNNSPSLGAFDADFYAYAPGVFPPTPAGPPPAPTNFVAVAYDAQVRLSWAPAPGATSYTLLRSGSSGGPYSLLASPAGTSYTDLDVVNDTPYYYVVAAVNAAGSSPRSAEVSATPKAAPSNVLAVGGTNEVKVTWTGLPNAESYTVRRATVSGGPYADLATGVTTPEYLDTAVQSGTAYFYVVQATLTGGGLSTVSFEASAVTAPSAATLTATPWAATTIQLKWTQANAVVSQFILQRSTDGANFTDHAVGLLGNPVYYDQGLGPSTTYFYRIQAQNSGGFSDYSNVASNTTPSGGWNVNFAAGANNSAGNPVAPTPPGYLQDVGELFGDQGNGYSYGWSTLGGTNITRDGRYRQNAASPDLRYDTFMHLMKANTADPSVSATWEIAIPNGFYLVHVVSGDADNYDGVYQYNIEGVLTTIYTPTTGARWGEVTNAVIVSDERLTLTSGPSAVNNKIAFIDIYQAVPVMAAIGTQPQSQTVEENRPVNFSVGIANGSEPLIYPLFYQWYTNGVEVVGANSVTLSIPLAQLSDAGEYYVVITNYAGSVTSTPAQLVVNEDLTAPQVISIGSVDGWTVGVCYDEILDTNAGIYATAIDKANYTVNEGAVEVTEAAFRPDGRCVQLTLSAQITGSFSVMTENIRDLTGENSSGAVTTDGEVFGLAQDLGFPLAAGSHYSCASNVLELVGGGADIWGTYDEGHFAYKNVTGDFDVKIRVDSLTLATLTGDGNIAKAGLMARSSIESNSPTLHLLANPPPPGRNLLQAGARTSVGGTTVNWGTNVTGVGTSNLWLRLTRASDSFVGYWSSNGVVWGQFASNSQVMPSALLLGAAVSCHTNFAGLLVTGAFSGFAITQPAADLAITKADAPDPVRLGSNVTFTITVANGGPEATSFTRVTDTLPAGVTFVSASASQGACSHAAGVVTCNLGPLNVAGSATITIVVTTRQAGTAENVASVTSNAVDPNPADNTARTTTAVFDQPTFLLGSLVYSEADGGSFTGSFQTVASIWYVVEYKDTLGDAAWTELAAITGDGSAMSFRDPGPLPPTRFYRIRLVLP